MSDETDDSVSKKWEPSGWMVVAMYYIVPLLLLNGLGYCFDSSFEEPEGPLCTDAKGNVTCIEYFGGNRPHCHRDTTIYKGCMTEPAPAGWAAPCGKMVDGLPDDPTCSNIVADNPPDPAVVTGRNIAGLIERWIIPAVALGSFLLITITVWGRAFLIARRSSSQVPNVQPLAADELPPPVPDNKADPTTESKDPSP